jgi:uncharacterized protein involved in exopolysaccharide biosynthesis
VIESQVEENAPDLRDIVAMLRRRRIAIVVTIAVLMLVTLVVALLWPATFRSTATILIQEQEIPQDLVRSTITSFADERIQVISQQVMTRAVLLQMVEKYNLYPTKRKYETSEEILERMRRDIKLTPINADVTDRRSGSRGNVTIAFSLAYDSETPASAQKVASELTSLYLNENVKNRQQRTAETTTFLAEETERLAKQIAENEEKLAAFKRANAGKLPELAAFNQQITDRTDSEMIRIEREISSLEERRIYLASQLGTIRPNTPIIGSTGERIPDPTDRLRMLRTQQASLSGVYSDTHPDMIRMRREITALEKETAADQDPEDREKQLSRLRTELATLTERYAADHPDIARVRRSIAALENPPPAPATGSARTAGRKADNPQYISFQAQLEQTETEIKTLRAMREVLRQKLNEYEARLAKAPEVEREYLELTRDHANAVTKYRETKAKTLEAEVANSLERDRKAERFSLIDPAQLPEKPFSPNRPMILLVGVLLSIAAGVGIGVLRDLLDSSVKNLRDLGRLVALPVLSTIPHVENAAERGRRLQRARLTAGAAIGSLLAATIAIHVFVMPLGVLWYVAVRKLSLQHLLF